MLIHLEMLALCLLRVDIFEPQRRTVPNSRQLTTADTDVTGDIMPHYVVVLKHDTPCGIAVDKLFQMVAVIERLLAGAAAPGCYRL